MVSRGSKDIQMRHVLLFTGLGRLQELDVESNKIQRIESGTFSDLKNLTYLDLSYNNLTHLNQVI